MVEKCRAEFHLSIAILLSLLPAVTAAEPATAGSMSINGTATASCPAIISRPSNSVPIYSHRSAARNSPSYDAPGFAAPGSSFPNYGTPSYWWDGSRYYFGDPGFLHGRYNGGSYGPCWTSTPIGLMWNCG